MSAATARGSSSPRRSMTIDSHHLRWSSTGRRDWVGHRDMRVHRIATVLLICGFALALALARGQPDDDVVEWIRRNAIPLRTPEAGHDSVDLQPLKQVIGDARIVSLGEATHGSREFFQLKH